EKEQQLDHVNDFRNRHQSGSAEALRDLQRAALAGENIFEALLRASRVCTLFQMTQALFAVGGEYRRNV
ncbi:MAG: hypothetical protein C5B49_11695, partial [Bdellovibrio sp.]